MNSDAQQHRVKTTSISDYDWDPSISRCRSNTNTTRYGSVAFGEANLVRFMIAVFSMWFSKCFASRKTKFCNRSRKNIDLRLACLSGSIGSIFSLALDAVLSSSLLPCAFWPRCFLVGPITGYHFGRMLKRIEVWLIATWESPITPWSFLKIGGKHPLPILESGSFLCLWLAPLSSRWFKPPIFTWCAPTLPSLCIIGCLSPSFVHLFSFLIAIQSVSLCFTVGQCWSSRCNLIFNSLNHVGRVLNRFTRDIGCMDELLPAVFYYVITVIACFLYGV